MEQSRIDLTQAEWQVMECLWGQAPRTGREAAEYMARRTGWSRSTTLTLLQRLEDKGAVSSREEGRKKVFSPVLRREDAALQETEDFLTRVYNGSVSLLVSSMTRRQALPQEEIDQLYALLQQLEDQKGAD